ncbi:hypothetical protein BpHYR1_052602, partial [Brachionus plicatilis]
ISSVTTVTIIWFLLISLAGCFEIKSSFSVCDTPTWETRDKYTTLNLDEKCHPHHVNKRIWIRKDLKFKRITPLVRQSLTIIGTGYECSIVETFIETFKNFFGAESKDEQIVIRKMSKEECFIMEFTKKCLGNKVGKKFEKIDKILLDKKN